MPSPNHTNNTDSLADDKGVTKTRLDQK
ncbi:hypothetical protein JL09_g6143 [Pichia kudriavzevii]|uniref:Uncharacterized protein n=1 Tax=Pichia kudriavzevii TaxID=4909 RepID=A0A099NPG8_PICKU|nr:hypothetical protein JL09_g6143 [Pichia kudriavzevii]